MRFEEIVEKTREKARTITPDSGSFLAVEVHTAGEGEGVFYVEAKDGRINVEPYEYNDKSCAVTMKGEDFIKLLDGKLDAVLAFTTGKLKVDGDVGKALEFSKLLKK